MIRRMLGRRSAALAFTPALFGRQWFRYGSIALAFVLSQGSFEAFGADSLPAKTLPAPGQVFSVRGHTAFLIPSETAPSDRPKPWVWYAPTLPGLPGLEERWMFQQFLGAGVAVAGIDVGESFGSPAGRGLFSALHEELSTRRGYARKAVLLGRSRGGLMALAWAEDHPHCVAAFAGIYPVCNLASYPGITNAAPAYGLTPAAFRRRLARFNPIDRLLPLARAGVPLFAIHGDVDQVVPLEANSGLVQARYAALGGSMRLIIPAGQGHNLWKGFFECPELVDFVTQNAGR